jgi:hypothetical protein
VTEQQRHPAEDRPVVNGLVALVAVALGVGLILALVALVGTKFLGLDDADGSTSADATGGQSMYLPTPAETTGDGGPLITLATEDTDEPTAIASPDAAAETEPTQATESASPAPGEISLQAEQPSVAAGDRIYFSGVYPGGEGAILSMQRWENGAWEDFPASVGVTNGTFSSYLFTGVTGVNRFRAIDRETGKVSNEIRVTVG